MEGLRGILAVVGLVIVALVYWLTKRDQARSERESQQRLEPSWGDDTAEDAEAVSEAPSLYVDDSVSAELNAETETADELMTSAPAAGEESESPLEQAEPEQPEKIIAIRLAARNAGQLSGEALVLTMRGLGLRHGKFGIFHRHDDESDESIFSVANLLEPGSFDLANIKDQEFPGVSFFMVLPGPVSGAAAFDSMVETARMMAKSLEGEVLDANGSSLSIQRERFIREEIIQYEHGLAFG